MHVVHVGGYLPTYFSYTEEEPAEQIIDLSEDLGAGVVVVGSRGQSGLMRAVLGSVSENVVRYAPCPVFVVRAEEGTRPPRRNSPYTSHWRYRPEIRVCRRPRR